MWATVGCATQVVWAGCAMLLLLLCYRLLSAALLRCAALQDPRAGAEAALSNHLHRRRIVELKRQTSFDQLERKGDGRLMLVQGRTASSKVGSGTSRTGASTSRSGSTTRKKVPCRVLRTMATTNASDGPRSPARGSPGASSHGTIQMPVASLRSAGSPTNDTRRNRRVLEIAVDEQMPALAVRRVTCAARQRNRIDQPKPACRPMCLHAPSCDWAS